MLFKSFSRSAHKFAVRQASALTTATAEPLNGSAGRSGRSCAAQRHFFVAIAPPLASCQTLLRMRAAVPQTKPWVDREAGSSGQRRVFVVLIESGLDAWHRWQQCEGSKHHCELGIAITA